MFNYYVVSVCRCSAKIAAGAVVCVESEIRGDVSIGEDLLLIHMQPPCLIHCVFICKELLRAPIRCFCFFLHVLQVLEQLSTPKLGS